MGHVDIIGTETYLNTTPELLALAGNRRRPQRTTNVRSGTALSPMPYSTYQTGYTVVALIRLQVNRVRPLKSDDDFPEWRVSLGL